MHRYKRNVNEHIKLKKIKAKLYLKVKCSLAYILTYVIHLKREWIISWLHGSFWLVRKNTVVLCASLLGMQLFSLVMIQVTRFNLLLYELGFSYTELNCMTLKKTKFSCRFHCRNTDALTLWIYALIRNITNKFMPDKKF